MKKIVLATLLALTTVSAIAADNFGKIEYAFRDVEGDPNKNGLNLQIGHTFNKAWAVDAKSEFRRENGSDTTSNRLELGTTYTQGNLFVRGGLGDKFTSGSDYTYYSIEPGFKYEVTDGLKLVTSYRYRNAFNTSNNDEQHRAQVGAEYAVFKEEYVTASFGRTWGDAQYNSVNVGYKVEF